jgi:hypothetical protein
MVSRDCFLGIGLRTLRRVQPQPALSSNRQVVSELSMSMQMLRRFAHVQPVRMVGNQFLQISMRKCLRLVQQSPLLFFKRQLQICPTLPLDLTGFLKLVKIDVTLRQPVPVNLDKLAKLLLAVQRLDMIHRNPGLPGNRPPAFAASYGKRDLVMMIAQSPPAMQEPTTTSSAEG